MSRTADHLSTLADLDAQIAGMEASRNAAEGRYCDGRSDEGGMSFIMGRGASQVRRQRDINAAGGTLVRVLAMLDGTPVRAEPVVDGFGKPQWKTAQAIGGRRYFPRDAKRPATLAKYGLQEVEALIPTDVILSATFCPIDRPVYSAWGV